MLRVKYLTRNIVAGQIFDPQHLWHVSDMLLHVRVFVVCVVCCLFVASSDDRPCVVGFMRTCCVWLTGLFISHRSYESCATSCTMLTYASYAWTALTMIRMHLWQCDIHIIYRFNQLVVGVYVYAATYMHSVRVYMYVYTFVHIRLQCSCAHHHVPAPHPYRYPHWC